YQAQAGDALGILHDGRLATLRWRRSDVARIELRRTRGAEIVGLIFERRSVELRLGLYHVHTTAEARTLLDSAPPQ
ncbi:MAG: hypothetical protein JO351_12835, partial [Candidatus Eremiobacteraeota bacterium]|nr:hypothetical protein [Candidatus Eremiobacteraeota bacterium]